MTTGAVGAALALTAPRVLAQTQCAPAADCVGEEAPAAAVREALARRGIAAPDGGCAAVRATVAAAADGLLVRVEDPWGRTSERSVADAEAAASLVESWARSDVGDPLLAPPERAHDAVPVREAGAQAEEPLRAEARAPASGVGATVALAGETSVAPDGSAWIGASLAGCLRIGWLCAGGIGRIDQDAGGGETYRVANDLLLFADVPVRLGRTVLRPGVGAGLGWIRTEAPGLPPEEDDTVEYVSGGLRLEAHALLAFAVGGPFSVEVGLHFDLSPAARGDPFEDDGVVLPREPIGFARASAGLRWGEP